MSIKHYYLHADLDAFFASVEQLDNPEYRGKPVIVGGLPDDRRSVVSTASYEARKFGVHSAMPTAKAYQLCPQGIYLRGRMKRYSELSYQIMSIFRDFSPDVQQLSIDEAFIDLTGTEKLFGPTEETALKIKQRVKTETGLTVSIGLAPTKYLAKIASDMKKPDGFYKIDHGTEQDFMLNLPLKKVWGIGDKTYESLKRSGLLTTRDIYEKSLEALVFMYGQNTGTFLYNVVRGIEIINFDRKTKSHSISNETTFPYDVSDIYMAETTLLELCHSVIFRLLKENGYSRTVMVKIRYEDFSTVSIQQTYPDSILTLDSLYNAAKELFERKYERGRGIRLLGLGLENIENTERPRQQSLFDDGSEKKQKVEKAILNLEKKHPEIKIHKARMLKNLAAAVLFLVADLTGLIKTTGMVSAQETSSLYLSDETSQAEISGSYKGTMDGSLDMTFGKDIPFGISADLPVFKQEVDLSAYIQITKNAYFSLEFLDEFKHNTYAFGYLGPAFLKELKLANRGITFPDYYSSGNAGYDIRGGENEAPGLMLNFTDYKNNKWQLDFLVRYDMTSQKSAVFYGKNSVSDSFTNLEDYIHSRAFVIPSDVISGIKDVYVQCINGSYTDYSGISYAKLTPSEYIISQTEKKLLLCDDVTRYIKKGTVPYILITFYNDSDCNILVTDTGSYQDAASFAGKIQEYFGTKVDLSEYSALSLDAITTQIENKKAVIIQSPVSFSPYLCANSYSVKGSDSTQYLVANKYSLSQNNSYSAGVSNEMGSFSQPRVIVVNSSDGTVTNDALLPQYRYPFASDLPGVYLWSQSSPSLVLVNRTTTPVKEYDIGKFADAGSVRVYRNGLYEPGATYDNGTGFVTLDYPAGELDKIYITYNLESADISNGMFTTGAGFVWNFTPQLVFDISFTGKYPYLLEKNFATVSTQKSSFSALTAGLAYNGKIIQVKDTLSGAFENNNLAKVLLVDCPDKSETTKSSSKINTTLTAYSDSTVVYEEISLEGAAVYNASYFEISLLPDQALGSSGAQVFLELGLREEVLHEKYPEWNLTGFSEQDVIIPLDINTPVWQKVKIRIPENIRGKLTGSTKARIRIEKAAGTQKGNLTIGSWTLTNQNTQTQSTPGLIADSSWISTTQNSSGYAMDLSWSSLITNGTITTLSYFDQADFSLYQNIEIEFAITKKAQIEFILSGPENTRAVDIVLKENAVNTIAAGTQNDTPVFHKLSIDTATLDVKIDGDLLDKADYELTLNRSYAPVSITTVITPLEENGHYYYSGLYFKNGQSVFSTKNQLVFALTGENKDNYLYATSTQGLSAVQGFANSNTPYINGNIKGSYTVAGINLYADADTNLTAGHSITTKAPLLSIFDFGEIYRYENTALNAEKKDYIKLHLFGFTLGGQTQAHKEQDKQNHQYSFELDGKIKAGPVQLIPGASYLEAYKDNGTGFTNEYFTSWYEVSKLQFSGNQQGYQKDIKLNATLQTLIPFAGLSPKVSVQATAGNNNLTATNRTAENSLNFSVPFSFANQAYSLGSTFKSSANYKTGQAELEPSLSPFSATLINEMLSSSNTHQYDFSWRRRLFNTTKDIFIPISASATLVHNTLLTDKDTSNRFDIKTSLERNFIYIAKNKTQHEFKGVLGLTYGFAKEKPQSPAFTISDSQNVVYYLKDTNIVNVKTDCSIDSFLNWKIKLYADWERITPRSLLQALTTSVFPVTRAWPLKTKINDSVTIALTQQDKKFRQSYGYMRTANMNFLTNYSFSTGAGITFSYEQGKALALSVKYTLGLNISF